MGGAGTYSTNLPVIVIDLKDGFHGNEEGDGEKSEDEHQDSVPGAEEPSPCQVDAAPTQGRVHRRKV